MAEQWIILAQLLRPQGRRGELLADVLTDFPERFSSTGTVSLLPPDSDTANAPREATIIGHWFPVGRNVGRVVLQFAGVDSITAAESLAGWAVALPQSKRMLLGDGAVYISDLIGCTLYDGDVAVGVIEDVEFPAPMSNETSAPDAPALLRVKVKGGTCLVPFVKAWLQRVDMETKRIVMNLPAGLIDINQK